MTPLLRAFFHPLPQAMLSIVLGVAGAAGYTFVHTPPLLALPGPTMTVLLVEDPETSLRHDLFDVFGGAHWGRMERPEGKDAATIIVGNSNERMRFVAQSGRTIALCACVTYEDALDAPRMQRDCTCTAGSVLATEPP